MSISECVHEEEDRHGALLSSLEELEREWMEGLGWAGLGVGGLVRGLFAALAALVVATLGLRAAEQLLVGTIRSRDFLFTLCLPLLQVSSLPLRG